MKTVILNVPTKNADAFNCLTAGDRVLLSGTIYTARDAAHRRICALIKNGEKLPFELDGACIYYCGPAPAQDGEIIGACGPTSSARMDALTIPLIERGLAATIGKGNRDPKLAAAMRGKAVYLLAVGGAAVYYRQFVTSAKVIAYPELGTEAITRLTVNDLPLLVGLDIHGNSIFSNSSDNKI